MAAKTRRIEMRVDTDIEERISRATQIEKVSVSAFVLAAATRAADRVLARTESTVMPADQLDAPMAALDAPDEAPRLNQIAARRRRFERT